MEAVYFALLNLTIFMLTKNRFDYNFKINTTFIHNISFTNDGIELISIKSGTIGLTTNI